MSPRVVLRLAVVLATIAALARFCAADKCKKKIRTIIYDRCNLRSKRSSPLLDSFGALPSDRQPGHEHAAKRQIMSIHEIFVASRVPIYRLSYPIYPRHQYAPPIPASNADVYRVQPPRAESLPQESHSEVGFEMSYEEMVELLDEFYERMPRGARSREEVQKEVWPLIEQCCKDIDHCKMRTDCPFN
ncbi:uncharacterized protein LOC131662793 [Phymastichus coffea]|uniref:uncharacterized protein LOC131662793 n=1 Tax=Phymastichus coffea TaxID=108790 RepID=UPI00273B8E8F|nr:uncharacterized protein LOC131662793 [Phymastichus coffea]